MSIHCTPALLLVAVMIASTFGVRFLLRNNCPYKIWPVIVGMEPMLEDGGFELNPGQTVDVEIPAGWEAGKIWARTGCDAHMTCETGSCGKRLQCSGVGAESPASFAEFTLALHAGLRDYYGVSYVNGYNVQIMVEPIAGTYLKTGVDYHNCGRAGECSRDVFEIAPDVLKLVKNGTTVAVHSACSKFPTDLFCCVGAKRRPEACNSTIELSSYHLTLKHICPNAYLYAFDDTDITFGCIGAEGRSSPDYRITFCKGSLQTSAYFKWPLTTDLTYYEDAGRGACGKQIDASSQFLAAVSRTLWTTPNPNVDPLCQKCVEVTYKEKTIKVHIEDKCASCAEDHVDLSVPAFTWLVDTAEKNVQGATYKIVECNGSHPLGLLGDSRDPPPKGGFFMKAKEISIGVTILLLLLPVSTLAAVTYISVRLYRKGKQWEIPCDEVQLEEQIGRGFFGVVFRAYYYGPVAVKQLFAAKPGPSERRAFRNEIQLLKSLRHTNVLGLLGVVTEPQLAIVTDWCHGSLYQQIHVAAVDNELTTVFRFCKQIAEGMNYLHSKGVLHRDLKTGNILLTEATSTTLKICDFGLSIVKAPRASDKKAAKNPVGSILWMAPEIINPTGFVKKGLLRMGSSPYSVYSDAYAFGICIYELMARRLPYVGYERDQITYLVGAGLLPLDTGASASGDDVTRELAALMNSCTSYRPSGRPTFQDICAALRGVVNECTKQKTFSEETRVALSENVYITVPQFDD